MPIRAAHLLNRMTELRFPNFMDRTTLMDVPGALADITLIASIYPNHFFKIGIMNRYGLFVTATRDLYTQNFNAEHNMNVALYEPAITVGPDPVTYTSLHSLRHERDEFPLQVRPDIRNDETSENMKEFLGQSTYELRGIQISHI